MGMKVNLSHCIKQIARSHPMHGAVLEKFEKHLRETIRGEHTLQELAEVYCLADPAPVELQPGYEMFDGKPMKVLNGERSGWWRFHNHYDRDGYCDNPARGY